jgi:hypothetical protein
MPVLISDYLPFPIEDQPMHVCRVLLFLPVLVFSLSTTARADSENKLQADFESARVNLLDCVYTRASDERAKDSPSADKLIARCKTEYDAFVAELHYDEVNLVMNEFKRQLNEALSK